MRPYNGLHVTEIVTFDTTKTFDWRLGRNNNLKLTTYRYGAVSRKTDFHVDISKYPGGEFLFSTWGRKNSSEESNETSEEMNHAHVENKKYPRGDFRFSTWIFEKRGNRTKLLVM